MISCDSRLHLHKVLYFSAANVLVNIHTLMYMTKECLQYTFRAYILASVFVVRFNSEITLISIYSSHKNCTSTPLNVSPHRSGF
jgi:hypothetical protein